MPIDTAAESTFGNIQQQMRALIDQMQKNFFNFCPSETWTPNVNLYENETYYIVCVDLAGVDKEKIEVTVSHQRLMLRGSRIVPTPAHWEQPQQAAGGGGSDRGGNDGGDSDGGGGDGAAAINVAAPQAKLRVHVMEIDHGPFCREVELPDNVDHLRIQATHRNGLLWIELPKSGPPGD